MTPEEIRERIDTEMIQTTALRVMEHRCQCCGGDGEPMDCGHLRCELCEMREHICIACALST